MSTSFSANSGKEKISKLQKIYKGKLKADTFKTNPFKLE
jgi:hypothetical protein